MKHGLFITFEGGEGAGKSTQVQRLAKRLQSLGRQVVVTREPGGSAGAEAVRHVLLSGAAEPFGQKMEAVLFAAARADHVDAVIRPAIKGGNIVLCDRFIDSSRVYQGATGGLPEAFMRALESVAIDQMMPDLTLILDLDPKLGLTRANARRGVGGPDRFEKESLEIHRRRRNTFLKIAADEPARCVVIDASRDADQAMETIWNAVSERLDVGRGTNGHV